MFMLDTNICIYIIKHKPESVIQRFKQHELSEFCLSMVTYAELYFGALKSHQVEGNLQQLQRLTEQISVFPWDIDAAKHYGEVRKVLERNGRPIGSNDMMIAGHALAKSATIVTNNLREFERVPHLQIENWAS